MSRPVRLFRVVIPVSNIDDVSTFYRQMFGTAGERVSSGRHYFDYGGVILALYDAVADGDPTPAIACSGHVYLAVPDLEAAYERASRLGALSTEVGDGELPMGQIAKRPWGELSFYLHDPSGNPLCVVDENTLFRGGIEP